MQLGLSKIIDCPGAMVDFSTSVDLSDLLYGTRYKMIGGIYDKSVY